LLKDSLVSEEEMKEITEFYDQVEDYKNKILDKVGWSRNNKDRDREEIKLNSQRFIEVLNENVSLMNVISEDTIKIYIETFFTKSVQENEELFIITEENVETFLTSILIFKND
jgi:hypothetical protein